MLFHCRHCWKEVSPSFYRNKQHIEAHCPNCKTFIKNLKNNELRQLFFEKVNLPLPLTPKSKSKLKLKFKRKNVSNVAQRENQYGRTRKLSGTTVWKQKRRP
jgi:hypothetical protein